MRTILSKLKTPFAIIVIIFISTSSAFAKEDRQFDLQCNGVLEDAFAGKKSGDPHPTTKKEISLIVTIISLADGRSVIFSEGDYQFIVSNDREGLENIVNIVDNSDENRWAITVSTASKEMKNLYKININRLNGHLDYEEFMDTKEFLRRTAIGGYCEKYNKNSRKF